MTLTYSVKRVCFNFPPLGAIKGGDAELLSCQKLLRNVAAEDFSQSQRPRHRGVIYAQETFNTDNRGLTTPGRQNNSIK